MSFFRSVLTLRCFGFLGTLLCRVSNLAAFVDRFSAFGVSGEKFRGLKRTFFLLPGNAGSVQSYSNFDFGIEPQIEDSFGIILTLTLVQCFHRTQICDRILIWRLQTFYSKTALSSPFYPHSSIYTTPPSLNHFFGAPGLPPNPHLI